jgi:crossover junction endodeoxyribonuclease RusA
VTKQSAGAELAAYLRNSPDVGIADLGGLNVRNAGDLGAATEQALERANGHAPTLAAQSIVLPLPPSANVYWRNYNGRTVVSESAQAYKAGVWLVAQQAGFRPYTTPVALYVHVYRARKAGDLDNFAKVLLDSLCGVAYADDDQIIELHMWRHDDKANPRVEVEARRCL